MISEKEEKGNVRDISFLRFSVRNELFQYLINGYQRWYNICLNIMDWYHREKGIFLSLY